MNLEQKGHSDLGSRVFRRVVVGVVFALFLASCQGPGDIGLTGGTSPTDPAGSFLCLALGFCSIFTS